MIPWIQVYSNLPQHPKTFKLAEELKVTSSFVGANVEAVGVLVSLWTWAIQNAYDGDLSGCSKATIADACRWKKKPETLVNALISAGFLDDDMRLHDWEEYANLLMDAEDNRREKTRERVRKYREKQKQAFEGIKCQYCGEQATGYDHVIPFSKGGRDVDENKVYCCPWCNSAKQDRPVIDFLNRNLKRVKPELVMSSEVLRRYVTFDDVTQQFVTVTSNACNAPTIHNHTIHNNTEPNNTIYLSEKERKERALQDAMTAKRLFDKGFIEEANNFADAAAENGLELDRRTMMVTA